MSMTDSSGLTLDYYEPPEDLRPYVSVFYDFFADQEDFREYERADLAQFRFTLCGSESRYRFVDGLEMAAPVIQIVGPTTGPTLATSRGPVHVFGCGLMPSGWGALMNFEASLLVNRVADARDFFGSSLRHRLEALQAAGDARTRLNLAVATLRALLAVKSHDAEDFTNMVNAWLNASASPAIEDLMDGTGLSRRQVERLCKRFYGSPPKVLARKYRALRTAIAIARGETECDTLEGFYDQSHLIREIKAFTGSTPRQITENLSRFTQLTLKRAEYHHLSPLITRT